MVDKIIKEDPYCFISQNKSNNYYRIDTKWVSPRYKKLNKLFKKLSKKDYNMIKLEELAQVKGGKRLPKGVSHLYTDFDKNPYVRGSSDLENLRIKFDNIKRISDSIYNKVNGIILNSQDILISIAGTTGRLGFFEFDKFKNKELTLNTNKIKFSENLAVIRSKNEKDIFPRFLLYYLNSHVGQFQLQRLTVGSNQGKISLNSLRNMYIPVPLSLKTQEKLIEEIEKYYNEIRKEEYEKNNLIGSFDEIIKNKFKINIPEIKKRYFKVPSSTGERIDSMYMNPSLYTLIDNIKSVKHCKILDIANVKKYNDYEIPVIDYYGEIKIDDIDNTLGEVKKVEDLYISDISSNGLLVEEGNIYVSRINPDLGNVFYANSELNGCITSSEMRALELKDTKVLPKYLWIMCRSQLVIQQWKCQISESSRRRIKKRVIENTIIPLLDKEEQIKLIKECEKLNIKIKQKRINSIKLKNEVKGILTKELFNIENIDDL